MLVVVVGMTVAACSDDKDDAKPSTSTVAATTTTAIVTTTAAGAATGTNPEATNAPAAARTLECGTVGFTPQTEDAASQITATGLSCGDAESFVRIAGTLTGSLGPEELEVEGYRCVRTDSAQEPLPRGTYECNNGARKVTFVRS